MLAPVPESPRRAPAILVTGGAGFIGRSLCARLGRHGTRVVALDDLSSGDAELFAQKTRGSARLVVGDAADPDRLAGLVADEGPFDVLVHFAARVGVPRVLADPARCRSEHEATARALLDVLADLPSGARPRLVAASTSEVYAEKTGPLHESDPLRDPRGAGRWHYAGSKLGCERSFDAAASLWEPGRGPVHLRFFNVTGPGQDPDSGMVLPTFVRQALAGQALTVHGDGSDVRTFAHVADVSAAVAEVVLRSTARGVGFPAGPLNLGGSARTTTAELAQRVVELAETDSSVERVDPKRSVGAEFEAVLHREPCLERARELQLDLNTRTLDAIISDTLRAAQDRRALA